MNCEITPEILERITQYVAGTRDSIDRADVQALLWNRAFLEGYASAGRQAATEQAKREYHYGSCDDCGCCTHAQCSEKCCPTDSIGDSVCPCTCD